MTRNMLAERWHSQYFVDYRGESRTRVSTDEVAAVLDTMPDDDRATLITRAAEISSSGHLSMELGCTDAMAVALMKYATAGGR
jgi:hypothetical protein